MQGIFRNPCNDFDRAGSFPYHMGKTVQTLISLLGDLDEHQLLAEVSVLLSKIPDQDKKYLANGDRIALAEHARNVAVAAARRSYKEIHTLKEIREACGRIHDTYHKLQRLSIRENPMGPVIKEAMCYFNESNAQCYLNFVQLYVSISMSVSLCLV